MNKETLESRLSSVASEQIINNQLAELGILPKSNLKEEVFEVKEIEKIRENFFNQIQQYQENWSTTSNTPVHEESQTAVVV